MITLLASAALAASLEGRVVDASGAPVEGAYAVVYDQRFAYAYAVTNAAGSFRIVDLPENPYRLRILPPATANLVETWHPAPGLSVCPAEAIELGDVTGVEVALAEGGEIVGILLDTDGQPVRDATLVARPTLSELTVQARTAVTADDGSFAIRGLPGATNGPSGWRIEVQVDGWPFQWLPGAYEEVDGAVYEVSPGGVADAGTLTLLDGVAVGGAVSGPFGPVTGGEVYAYSPSQVVSAPIVDGRYLAIGLPPGEVLSWASADGLAMTYYPDADRPGDRVEVLGEGTVYEALDLDVPAESVFQGRIAGADGVDLSGVSVLAYNDTRTVGLGAQCAENGTFAIRKLHGGAYTLFVYASDEGFVDDFVRDATGEPVVFDIPTEAWSPVYEIAPPRGAVVSGRIVDADGEPIYGAWVIGEGVTTGEVESAETDHDGGYVLNGLVADLWELRVDYHAYCPSDAGWVDLYWPETPDPARAGRVDLAEGEALTWDVTLAPDDDHDLMDDDWEAANGLDPLLDDGAEDPDGDGYTNLEEYRLGTDPQDAGARRGGCGCATSGSGGYAAAMLVIAAVTRRRRRMSSKCQLLNGGAAL